MHKLHTEPLNTSSGSIIIKDDSNLDSFVALQEDNEKNYDLEVQKPSERAKILKDSDFFKKLSASFYAESGKHYKSLQVLPRYEET
mgnify:CR=1 FL=1